MPLRRGLCQARRFRQDVLVSRLVLSSGRRASMSKRLAFLAAVLFTLGLAAAFAATPGRLRVIYYYLPG